LKEPVAPTYNIRVAGKSLTFDFTAPAPVERSVPAPPVESPKAEPPKDDGPTVLSVAALGRLLKGALESEFEAGVWVEGEIAGLKSPASGHLYFSIKDSTEDAVLDAVMYRSAVTPRTRSIMRDGAKVRLRGKPDFWTPRGRLQFVAERATLAGEGEARRLLEELKAKLTAEGIFRDDKKRPLPKAPRRIGVVTSAQGAVIHDIARVAFRRGGANILLASAQVQGAGAAQTIVRQLALLQQVSDVDVIIVARGGGSSEDLSAFNDEALVRAVAACRVPVVSAVGHEVDVTLCDFAADLRASTPSQAAERVVPDTQAQVQRLATSDARLHRAVEATISRCKNALLRVERRLKDPRLLLASSSQHIDDLAARLQSALRARVRALRQSTQRTGARLDAAHPKVMLAKRRATLTALGERMSRLAQARLSKSHLRVGELSGRLDALSPLKVLGRGYAIATVNGKAVRSASDVTSGDAILVRVHDGVLRATVTGSGASGT
jgi:exodeoxyribonuclease VII large subunit